MSRFFPVAEQAEDQPYAKIILYDHVIHRGFATGALLGALTGAARSALSKAAPPLSASVIRSTGVGGLIGAAVLGVGGTAGRMWGREDVEWQDRSWRLLVNKFQVEVDDFSVAGTIVGTAMAFARESGNPAAGKAVRIVGGAGLGNLAGVAVYMAYRHGLKGGKFE